MWGQRLLSDCLLEEPTRNIHVPFSYSDSDLCDLAIFAEPLAEVNNVSVSDVRKSLANLDTSNPFCFLFGDKMEHYRTRKAVLYRNPYNELFIRRFVVFSLTMLAFSHFLLVF